MNISAETKPSLEGSDRVLVTMSPTYPCRNAGVLLNRMSARYEHLVRTGALRKPVVNEIARTWGLPYPMAERLLKGELPVRLETNGAIAVFMNAQELLECHQARVALGDGPCQTLYDPEYWKCPIYGEDRRRRIGNVLHFHARDENSRRSGFVGGEAQLTELLRDLRVWGDAYRVDLLGCLSRAFDWAV